MYGYGGFVKCSLFNHSCAPNIFRRTKNGVMSMYALRTIEKGRFCVHLIFQFYLNIILFSFNFGFAFNDLLLHFR